MQKKDTRLIIVFLVLCAFGGAPDTQVPLFAKNPDHGTAAETACSLGPAAHRLLEDGPGERAPDVEDLRAILEPIRVKHGLPALGAAVVTGQGLEAVGVAGVRKAGTDVPATVEDKWHIGSDTKAMTAFLIASLVEQGKLKWETTIGEAFPDLVGGAASPRFGKISIRELLSHRSGLPANIPWGLIPRSRPIRDQRLAAVKAASSAKLDGEAAPKFLYSNLGYVIAGAMAEEQAAGAAWEELMKKMVFGPLGMTSAGFGGVGTPGEIDQPWGHAANGKPVKEYGPDADNPPVVGPAGTVHCTLADWAKFIADLLRGARGEKALLIPATYEMLQTPVGGGNYALGWLVTEREWGGGKVLTHSGSNTMNLAVAWVAPLRNFAVLVVTNQGPPTAAKACDEAASALVGNHLKTQRPAREESWSLPLFACGRPGCREAGLRRKF